jgi:outer membrane protein OmpA-like peptidoglycan-associated protein
MSASMITALQGLVTPGLIKTVSSTLGESESAVTSGLEGIVSKILAAMTAGTTNPGMMNTIAGLVANQVKDPNALGDITGLLTGSSIGSIASVGGSQLIGSLFGVKESSIAQAAAAAAGLKPKSGAALMQLAGPLVLGALGKAPGAATLTGSALPALLTSTWPTVAGITTPAATTTTVQTSAPVTQTATAPASTYTGSATQNVAAAATTAAAAAKVATQTVTTAATQTAQTVTQAATQTVQAATQTATQTVQAATQTVQTAAAPVVTAVKAAAPTVTTTVAPTVTTTATTAAAAAPAARTVAAEVAKDVKRATTTATHVAREEHRSGGGWWLWPVTLALIGGLTWAVWNMQMKTVKDLPAVKAEEPKVEKKVEAPAPVVAEKKVEAPAPAPAVAPEPTPAPEPPKVVEAPAPTPAPEPAPVVVAAAPTAVAGPDGMMRMALPSGPEITYATDGLEGKLVNFLVDPAKVVDKNVWFDFDRLQFETGSTRLKTESKAQIDNVVEIMKAFPASVLKIGGYTDNVGDPVNNKKLSDDRAKVVAAAIVGAGIDGKRIEAEGYGEEHPIGDNSTPEGRAKNRRTALSVRGK